MRKFRRVCFAKKNSTRFLETFDGQGILLWNKVLPIQGAERRADAFGLQDILDQERHAFERSGGFAPGQSLIGLSGLIPCTFIQGADRV